MGALPRPGLTSIPDTGFCGPFRLIPPPEVAGLRRRVEAEVLDRAGPAQRDPLECRHQDAEVVRQIAAHPGLTERLRPILGSELVLWHSVFVVKPPGGREIPWHQDQDHELLDPPVNVVAWVAIDDTSRDNGCLEILPGTHQRRLRHRLQRQVYQFPYVAEHSEFDTRGALALEMSAGEAVLMHPDLLHRSGPNLSAARRAAVVLRYTVPGVEVAKQHLFPAHECFVVPGGPGG